VSSSRVQNGLSGDALSRESYAREFNRFEFKYRSTFRERERLLESVGPFIRSDINADASGIYKISSLYYDSPGLLSFWEKIDGVKWRRKLRLRVYHATPSMAYLEIKQRIDKTVQKRRARMPLDEAEEWLRSLQANPPSDPSSDDAVLREIEYLFKTRHTEPKIVISYQREAFFATNEEGLRITFDSRLKYRSANLSLRERLTEEGHYFCHPEEVIIEVKFNHRIPLWLCAAIQHLELQAERVSKYCFGVNSGFFHEEMKL
jgi:hypothetical protein